MNIFIRHTRLLAIFIGLACFSVNSWGMQTLTNIKNKLASAITAVDTFVSKGPVYVGAGFLGGSMFTYGAMRGFSKLKSINFITPTVRWIASSPANTIIALGGIGITTIGGYFTFEQIKKRWKSFKTKTSVKVRFGAPAGTQNYWIWRDVANIRKLCLFVIAGGSYR